MMAAPSVREAIEILQRLFEIQASKTDALSKDKSVTVLKLLHVEAAALSSLVDTTWHSVKTWCSREDLDALALLRIQVTLFRVSLENSVRDARMKATS